MHVVVQIRWLAVACAALTITAARGQEILSTLTLDPKEPKPLLISYSPADRGLVSLAPETGGSIRSFNVIKYDNNLRRQWKVALPQFKGQNRLEGLQVLGSTIVVLVSQYIPRANGIQVSVYRFSLAGDAYPPDTLGLLPNESDLRDALMVERSPDNQWLAVVAEELPNFSLGQEAAIASVVVWKLQAGKREIEQSRWVLPVPPYDFEIKEVRVSGSGLVSLLTRQYPKDGGNAPPRFWVYRQQANPYEIKADDGQLTDATLRYGPANELFVAGYFSQRLADENRVGGMVYVTLAEDTLQPPRSRQVLLPDDVRARFLSPKGVSKGREIPNLYLDRIVPRSDGGALIFSEQFFFDDRSVQTINGPAILRNFFVYEDIVILSVSPQGQVEWSAVLDKYQAGLTREELSYTAFIGPEKIYLIYKTDTPGSGTNVYYTTLDEEGILDIPRPIFEGFRAGDQFFTSASFQLNNAEGILVYYLAKGRRFSVSRMGL